MNRRDLLKRMGLAALVLPSTKLIFDMGAHKKSLEPFELIGIKWRINPEWEAAPYEACSFTYIKGYLFNDGYETRNYRYNLNSTGDFVIVPKFITT